LIAWSIQSVAAAGFDALLCIDVVTSGEPFHAAEIVREK